MPKAKTGDTVKVHYTGKLTDGSIFDSSADREPLEFNLGEGQVIPGFENAITDMETGETKTVLIPADEAYGQRRDDLVAIFSRDKFPENIKPQVGQMLQLNQPNGQALPVTIIEVTDKEVTLDANHPLAGKDLTFELKLVEIVA